jgi:hypothetical protein
MHTDFNYADVDGNNILCEKADSAPTMEVPRRQHILPYLNGRPVRGVQRASSVEGWVDIAANLNCPHITRRIFGQVQLLWATPERRREFYFDGADNDTLTLIVNKE